MKKFLLHSTLIGVFSEALVFYGSSVDIKFFYFSVLFNLLLLIISQKKVFIPKYFFLLVFFLLCSSVFTNLEYNSYKGYLQFFGILFAVVYFYNFFIFFSSDIRHIIFLYCRYAFWLCLIGLVLFFYNFFIVADYSYRLKSLMSEPAHFAAIVSPAFYIFSKYFKDSRVSWFVVFFSIILSFSSIGYVCLVLSVLLLSESRKALRNTFIFLLLIVGVNLTYILVPDFKLRVDDTFFAFSENDVSDVNLSTYALVSNFQVAKSVFFDNPFFGGGLGSHPSNHQRIISDITGYDSFSGPESLINLNSEDANSLFLRVGSELGLVGLFLIFLFLIRNFKSDSEEIGVISNAVLVYFVYKLIREGNYFPPEMYFFVMLYYFNGMRSKYLENRLITE